MSFSLLLVSFQMLSPKKNPSLHLISLRQRSKAPFIRIPCASLTQCFFTQMAVASHKHNMTANDSSYQCARKNIYLWLLWFIELGIVFCDHLFLEINQRKVPYLQSDCSYRNACNILFICGDWPVFSWGNSYGEFLFGQRFVYGNNKT